jgi:hypothetical protein
LWTAGFNCQASNPVLGFIFGFKVPIFPPSR